MEFFRWGCPIASLHYRGLQRDVNFFLAKGLSYNSKVSISDDAKSDLDWWLLYGSSLPSRSLSPFSADITLFSDASNSGWGAWTSDDEVFGKWSLSEQKFHINFLELQAVFLAFQALFRSTYDCSILVMSDNMTVVSYINKQGGTSSRVLCDLSLSLWQFCVNHGISLSSAHVAGIHNSRADKLSRLDSLDHDYYLLPSAFSSVSAALSFPLCMDLFASRLNYKISPYVSWHNDPFSSFVNAFSFKWNKGVYLFPPLPLLEKVLGKIDCDNVLYGFIVCPFWPSQPWFAGVLNILIDFPFLFSPADVKDPSHVLPRSCLFLGCPFGSELARRQAFQRKLQDVPFAASQRIPWLDTRRPGENSVIGVVEEKLVTVRFLSM